MARGRQRPTKNFGIDRPPAGSSLDQQMNLIRQREERKRKKDRPKQKKRIPSRKGKART